MSASAGAEQNVRVIYDQAPAGVFPSQLDAAGDMAALNRVETTFSAALSATIRLAASQISSTTG
jgi:hypothetical protein